MQTIDPGVYNVRWGDLQWSTSAPVGTRVLTYVRFADVADSIETSKTVCGPFEQSPAILTVCSGGKRYARVEFHLSGAAGPAVGNVKLSWDRP